MSSILLDELKRRQPLLDCKNKEEFKQRLQWLAEGMLLNHIQGVVNYKINEREIKDYTDFKNGFKSH